MREAIMQDKFTSINVYIKDVLEPTTAGWELGIWSYGLDRPVWGLAIDGFGTHMCYDYEQNKPQAACAHRILIFKTLGDKEWLRWYFDVGRKLYVTVNDLRAGCEALGIWK